MVLLLHSCPTCGFPRLAERQGTHRYQYAGEFVEVQGIEFCECPHCHRQLVLDAQEARNRERISIANLEALASKWAATRTVELPPPRPTPTPTPPDADDGNP